MGLTLSEATPSDFPAIVRAQYAAFHPHESMHRILWPSPDPPTPTVLSRTVDRQLQAWQADPHITWLKVTDDETGEVVAAAKWFVWAPESKTPDAKDGAAAAAAAAVGPQWPAKISADWILESERGTGNCGAGVEDKPFVEYIVEEFFQRRRERIQGPCVLLDQLFCAPAHQRRGAGKLLVKWGTQRADELGVKGFVEASFTGRRLYESCGFKVTEQVCLEGVNEKEEWKEYDKVEYLFMERDATPLVAA
jgi:GNAT superfamily N-acetyltransferase